LRDTYVKYNEERKDLKILRFHEKEKQKWYRLKRVFEKKQMKSILAVEYISNGNIIRTTS